MCDLMDLIFLGSFLNLAVSQASRIYLTSESKQNFNQIIVFSLIWIICVYKMCCTELKLFQFHFHQMYYQLIFFDWKFKNVFIIYCWRRVNSLFSLASTFSADWGAELRRHFMTIWDSAFDWIYINVSTNQRLRYKGIWK